MNAQASTFVVQPVQAPHATDAADGNLVVVALATLLHLKVQLLGVCTILTGPVR